MRHLNRESVTATNLLLPIMAAGVLAGAGLFIDCLTRYNTTGEPSLLWLGIAGPAALWAVSGTGIAMALRKGPRK